MVSSVAILLKERCATTKLQCLLITVRFRFRTSILEGLLPTSMVDREMHTDPYRLRYQPHMRTQSRGVRCSGSFRCGAHSRRQVGHLSHSERLCTEALLCTADTPSRVAAINYASQRRLAALGAAARGQCRPMLLAAAPYP